MLTLFFSPFLLLPFPRVFLAAFTCSNTGYSSSEKSSSSVSDGSDTSSVHHNRRYQYSESVIKDMTSVITQATQIRDRLCKIHETTFHEKNLYRQYRHPRARDHCLNQYSPNGEWQRRSNIALVTRISIKLLRSVDKDLLFGVT